MDKERGQVTEVCIPSNDKGKELMEEEEQIDVVDEDENMKE